MYNAIIENSNFELVEKKSRFIANLLYIESKEHAEIIIKEFKKKYYDARHNCYAYRVLTENEIYEKSSDDGEPSGTAGAPMLNILQKNNLCNVIIIVTRYFGGILLGTGGLVRAYSNATIGAIEKSEFVEIELGVELEVMVDYANYQNLQYYCNKYNINIVSSEYNENILLTLEMTNTTKEKFLNDINNKAISIDKIINQNNKYIITKTNTK